MPKLITHTIITIGRASGSGGREIGKIVADELSIPFYDKEILEIAAAKSGLAGDVIAALDEKRTSGIYYALAMGSRGGRSLNALSLEDQVFNIQRGAILETAAKGPCVIVGRRADQVLRDDYDVVSVFISASEKKRAAHVAEREGLTLEQSQKMIRKVDRERAAYYGYFGEGQWGKADNYRLCLDSGELGPTGAAKMIIEYLRIMGKLAPET